MLQHTTASACLIGHAPVTSSWSGTRKFASAASSRHAEILASATGSGSLGTHATQGKAAAKNTACSPEPAAISSTVPVAGNTRARTS